MDLVSSFSVTKKHVHQSSVSNWLVGGWHLFKTAPVKLTVVMLSLFVIEGVIQIIPGPTGMLLSKWVASSIVIALWPLMDNLAKSGKFHLSALKKYSGWRKAAMLAVILASPFLLQVFTAFLLMGQPGLDLILFAEAQIVPPIFVSLVLISAIPLVMLLQFSPAKLLIDKQSVFQSLVQSVRMVIKAWRPMMVLALVNVLLIGLAPYTFALSFIFFGPWLCCVNYQAYRALTAQEAK
ncbi:hypothetical protein OPS25_01505 [Alteromonas ponticola]|uniref:DUF624 domain-containing protein n=1 Tax=Alteromonas aquimaris TaxID=2998417 RepID=A0ABT3P339_9ALTE|nr:hypothetical protein [Alteromonas aquimaris]MCW8107179.1 hypothetical protein [Alteromonas aquimaris]